MSPIHFDEVNTMFSAPPDMHESQIRTIPAYLGKAEGGSCDGAVSVVVCYEFTDEEIKEIINNRKIYLTMLGGLAPHYLSFNFYQATHPA